jgi:hypothetical protein
VKLADGTEYTSTESNNLCDWSSDYEEENGVEEAGAATPSPDPPVADSTLTKIMVQATTLQKRVGSVLQPNPIWDDPLQAPEVRAGADGEKDPLSSGPGDPPV